MAAMDIRKVCVQAPHAKPANLPHRCPYFCSCFL